ncbi:serum response factor b isoform X1 [Acipenser oxyrinchus oxyrinchus]|uniref:Serum response factor n=1 Tax=Acipenser oxyrinchus oxyrinchus TaxID=40147 RepID=A0AAD8GAY3_ACIOX|nr:serum response factor b isoform X1 [Acipenser oxyrinchus oxyrinchus]
MLPSQAGSVPASNRSGSGKGNAGHGVGVIGSGVATSLARAGLVGVSSTSISGGVVRSGNGAVMLGGNGAAGGSRGGQRPGNGAGLAGLQGAGAGVLGSMGSVVGGQGVSRFDPDRETSAMVFSGSDADSDSGDDDDLAVLGQGSISRGVKRERAEMETGVMGQVAGTPTGGYGGVSGGVAGAKPGKKTRGRVKIKMEFIDNKLRRYTTFSKRKTGIMKKAYELSTLTGTQVLLLVASETGHVYTFATRKLQPMITSETGKALIQTCLNSPDSPPRSDPSTDQRMSATGFEETDLTYQVSESESIGETKDTLKPAFTVTSLPGTSTCNPTAATTSTTMQVSSGASFPITNYLAPISASSNTNSITSANGTVLKTAATSGGVMQLPSGFTFMSGTPLPPGTPTIPISQLQSHSLAIQGQPGQSIAGPQGQQTVFRFPASVSLAGGTVTQQLQAIQVHSSTQHSTGTTDSGPENSQASPSSAVSLPATIVTSSVPTTMAGHMMYPSPHTLMYASTPALSDGSLAVLNAFSQAPSAMQVSHGQVQEQGGVPQVFLTGPPGTVQIPVSAVQLHPMVIGQQSSNSSHLTELQVVNLDTAHNSKSE